MSVQDELDLPPIVDDFIDGRDLKEGMIIICVVVMILSWVPPISLAFFCRGAGENAEFGLGDPIVFAPFFAFGIALAVLIILWVLDSDDDLVHFIALIIWIVITVWILFWGLWMIFHVGNYGSGICGIAHLLTLIAYVLLVIIMVYGVIVYWSLQEEYEPAIFPGDVI